MNHIDTKCVTVSTGHSRFKRAHIYLPSDEKKMGFIRKEMAVAYCKGVVEYMDSLLLDDSQKAALIEKIVDDLTD